MSTNNATAAIQHHGFACPIGGKFYICEGAWIEFVGCCTSDPCADGVGICPEENLHKATFARDKFKDLPPLACKDRAGTDIFYTCATDDTTFLGCCKSNPCMKGTCPTSDLVPAVLPSEEKPRALFLMSELETPSDSSSSTTAATSAPNFTLVSSSRNGGGRALPSGAVAGIAVSATILVIVALLGILWKYWWGFLLNARFTNYLRR